MYHTEDYFIDTLTRLLEDSVRIQLRSDVPVGAHLSGGLDSSTITCIAASLYNSTDSKLKTFSGAFREGQEYNESRYAKIVSDFAHTEYHEVFPEAEDFSRILPRLIFAMDEPAAGPGLFPQYFVSKLAGKHVKVVLGGQGGDEIFGGYARYLIAYLEQCLKGAIFETQEEGKHVVTLDSIVPNLATLKQYVPTMKKFWRKGLFDPMDRRYFSLINRTEDNFHLLNDELLAKKKEYSAYEEFNGVFRNANSASYINKMLYFDIKASLPALLQVEDRTSMAVSLESRVPLLDHRIVELMASVPPRIKFKNGEMKYLLRKAVKNIIPVEVLDRKDKMGFPVPLSEWCAGSMHGYLQDTLICDRVKERRLYDMKKLESLLSSEGKFGRSIWGFLCLELWFRTFIDDDASWRSISLGRNRFNQFKTKVCNHQVISLS